MAILNLAYARYIYFGFIILITVPLLVSLVKLKNIKTSQQMLQVPQKSMSQIRSLLLKSVEDRSEFSNATDTIVNSDELSLSSFNDSDVYDAVDQGILTKNVYESGFTDARVGLCPNLGKDRKLLILITSAPPHREARNAIRDTWSGYAKSQNISVGFILGKTLNETINKMIEDEQAQYGDLIRGKSIDSYDNLTLKTISVLEWVDNYCPMVSFVLKTDDDVFINIFRLLDIVEEFNPEEKSIYGRLAKNWKPIRDKKSKYYTSFFQYNSEVFPEFTTGPAYVFPAAIAKMLYDSALNYNYFKLEDVFVTGMVAEGLRIRRLYVRQFINRNVSITACNLKKHISYHSVKSHLQYIMWKVVLLPKPQHCKIRR